MRTVYLNGAFVPESEAKLSIYDLSVMQAVAAFEMTRSFHGDPFKLSAHLDRLKASCALLSIPWPRDYMDLPGLCRDVSRRNTHGPGEEHRLLIVVSPGCAPMYKDLAGVIPHPFLYIADFPLRYTVQGFGTYFTEGVHCVTSTIQQVPDACIPSAAKHRSRLHFHLAQQQVPAGVWPILLNTAGVVTEAPGANLMYVKEGQVFGITAQALPGISLATAMELSGAEPSRPIGIEDLAAMDEVWLTGTPFCMLPVVSLDGQPIGDGTMGPVYRQTLDKWSTMVGLDIAGQIQTWDAQARLPQVAISPALWTPDAQRSHAN